MKQKELSTSTGQDLLEESKEIKSTSFTNAMLIGFMIGIIIYSIVKNSWGIVTLIPLYLVYKLAKRSDT